MFGILQNSSEVIQKVDEAKKFPKPIVTTLEPLGEFYPAEDYHQAYLGKEN